MKKIMVISGLLFAAFCGCDRHPMKDVSDIADEGLLPGINTTFIVYDDELKTGGNFFLYPGGDNQHIDFSNRDNPLQGTQCIMYSWNGRDVFDASIHAGRHDFAGLDIAVSHDSEDFDAVPAVDLSPGGYRTVIFWIRGVLASNTTLKIEALHDGTLEDAATCMTLDAVSSAWEEKELTIDPATNLGSVKEFFKVTFIYAQPLGTATPGGGGTVYLDFIRLEQ